MNRLYNFSLWAMLFPMVLWTHSISSQDLSGLLTAYFEYHTNFQGEPDWNSLADEKELAELIHLAIPDSFHLTLVEKIGVYNFLYLEQAVDQNDGSQRNKTTKFKSHHKVQSIDIGELRARVLKESETPWTSFLLSTPFELSPPYITDYLNMGDLEIVGKNQFSRMLQKGSLFKIDDTLYLPSSFENDWKKSGLIQKGIQAVKNYTTVDYIKFYPLKWQLRNSSKISNKTGQRYFFSNILGKGTYQIRWFNNYYRETTKSSLQKSQYHFLTSELSFDYGLLEKLEAGILIRLRSTVFDPSNEESKFAAIRFQNLDPDPVTNKYSRAGFSQIAVRLKHPVIQKYAGWSMQHSIYFPFSKNQSNPFLDWSSPSYLLQNYFDHSLGTDWNLFFSVDFLGENLGDLATNQKFGFYKLSVPLTFIPQYFINSDHTLYVLGSFSYSREVSINQLQEHLFSNSNYGQLGLGYKYILNSRIELEALCTRFYSVADDREAHTFNIGFRWY